MRTYFLLIVLMLLPIFASAQYNNQQLQQSRSFERQMNTQNQKWASERDRADRQWAQQAMNRRLMNKNATEDKKISSEENNKKKLEEKTAKLDSDLKVQKDKLTTLENSNNSAGNQKDIEKTKEQISKTEEKLNKVKSELETSSKKLDDLKKEKEISLTKQADLEKKEKEEAERKKKQEQINQALLKSIKSDK